MSQKTIPLSLHTRRVVSVFAITLMRQHRLSPAYAAQEAFELLGYPVGTPDQHNLRAQVITDCRTALWGEQAA
jgi:hypothetical protein